MDQAGELGANLIYQGQHAVFSRGRDKRVADIVQVSHRLSRRAPLLLTLDHLTAHVGRREEAHRYF